MFRPSNKAVLYQLALLIVGSCVASLNSSRVLAAEGGRGDGTFITSAAALSCKAKPPLWSNPRTLSSANWTMQMHPGTHATRVVIRHAPIPGVTPDMMVWLFRNMDKEVADPRALGKHSDKEQRHKVFVLMHPIDNVEFKYAGPVLHMNATDPSEGTAWHFAHFYAASCTPSYQQGTKRPWVTCPVGSSRQAFNCTTPQHKIATTLSLNTTGYYAQHLDHKGFSAVGTLGSMVVSKVNYTWQQTSSGLQITQDVVFGIDEPWAAPINAQGLQDMLGKATRGDAKLGVASVVLHEVEIMGWYPHWLPAVYNTQSGNSGSSSSSSKLLSL